MTYAYYLAEAYHRVGDLDEELRYVEAASLHATEPMAQTTLQLMMQTLNFERGLRAGSRRRRGVLGRLFGR